jgi:hypothetical protein
MSAGKKYYRKIALTYIGLLTIITSIICVIVFSIIIHDKSLSGKIIVGFIILGIIGLIMFVIAGNFDMLFSLYRNHGGKISIFYDYKKMGVPNNKYLEFQVSFNDVCNKNIYLEEVTKGIYKGTINNKIIVFDMKGWHNQTYYIYEYFLSILQVMLANNNKKKLIKELKCNVDDIKLFIKKKNGNIKKYSLVKNQFTKPSFKFKERIKIKVSVVFTDKININSLYEFNG